MKQIWLILLGSILLLAAVACSQDGPAEARSLPHSASEAALPDGDGTLPGDDALAADVLPEASPAQNEEELFAAFDTLTSFGEGEAGVSLKTAIAAAALLNWAEDHAGESAITSISASMARWLEATSDEQQLLFWQNWPSVCDLAFTVCRDVGSYRSLFQEAGTPLTQPRYALTKFERLSNAVDRFLYA